jgi:hypothetical protein
MHKLIMLILFTSFFSSSVFAQIDFTQRDKYLQINKFLSPEYDEYGDINYAFLVPQYEDEQDPAQEVTLEISSAMIDDTPASARRLQWLKDQLAQEDGVNSDFTTEIIAIGKHGVDLKNDRNIRDLIDQVSVGETVVSYDNIPSEREPARFGGGRVMWTLIRGGTITGGTFASIYFTKDISPMKAFSIGLVSGIASGALTYFSGAYGRYLTSGAWSKWLMESNSIFARGFRRSLGISGKSFGQMMVKQKDILVKKYPHLANNPELFDKMVWQKTKDAFDNNAATRLRVLGKMKGAEKYLKWWVNSVAYTTVATKIPQAVAGIGVASSFAQVTGEVLSGATMSVVAQGPGSIAIEVRKYQKVEELRQAILSGRKVVDNKNVLLAEIKKVLAKEGPHASYVINSNSHRALQSIENWARSRQTMLSFFSVVGVGMEVAGIPLGRPMLLATGVGGGFYYAHVNGAFTEKTRLGRFTKKIIDPFKKGISKLKPLPIRHCWGNFVPRVQ